MASNADDLHKIWERIEKGVDIDELDGFLSQEGFRTIVDNLYNPFAHCDDVGKREWYLYLLYAAEQGWEMTGFWQHTEWILQRQFNSPDEWIGEEGIKFRKQWMRRPEFPAKTVKAWEAFKDMHRQTTFAEIEAKLTEFEAADAAARR